MFKNKKFRPRSLPSNFIRRSQTATVEPFYNELGNRIVNNQDNVNDTLLSNNIFSYDIITKCLTNDCKDCTGLYRNKFIRHGFLCRCVCHERSNIVNSESGDYKIVTSIADVKNEIVNISERGGGGARSIMVDVGPGQTACATRRGFRF